MNIDVKDKVVIITGASGLIGGAFADAFAEHGAIVIIANRSDDLGMARQRNSPKKAEEHISIISISRTTKMSLMFSQRSRSVSEKSML